MVGEVVHVFHKGYKRCLAAIVTEVIWGTQITVEPFYPPTMPQFRKEEKQVDYGTVLDGGKWHTIEDCRHYRNKHVAQEIPFSHKPEDCPLRFSSQTMSDREDVWMHGCHEDPMQSLTAEEIKLLKEK